MLQDTLKFIRAVFSPAKMRLISLQLILSINIATGIAMPLDDLLSQHFAPEHTYSPDATCGNGYSCNPKIALGGKCCAEDNTCGKSQENPPSSLKHLGRELKNIKIRKHV